MSNINVKREIREGWMKDLIERRKESCIAIFGEAGEEVAELDRCLSKMVEISRTDKSLYHSSRRLIETYEACEEKIAEIAEARTNEQL